MAALVPPPMDLGSWISRKAAAGPDRPAVTFNGRTTSYREFLGQIDRLAGELAAGGVGRGDRVGYLGANHPMFLVALFAAARLGAVFVPLNFRLTGSTRPRWRACSTSIRRSPRSRCSACPTNGGARR